MKAEGNTDTPTLVLLPGMDGTGLLFDSFIQAMGESFPLKTITHPENEPLGYGELESLVMDSLPAGPYVLLGESFSGPIAIALAASLPARIKGLILCCTFARNPHPSLAALRGVLPILLVHALPTGLLGYFLLGGFSTADLRNSLDQALARISTPVLKTRLQAVLDVDVSSRLPAIGIPTLYLRAAHDRAVPRNASALVAKALPETRIVELDAPHFLLQTRPEEAARIIRSFMEEL